MLSYCPPVQSVLYRTSRYQSIGSAVSSTERTHLSPPYFAIPILILSYEPLALSGICSSQALGYWLVLTSQSKRSDQREPLNRSSIFEASRIPECRPQRFVATFVLPYE